MRPPYRSASLIIGAAVFASGCAQVREQIAELRGTPAKAEAAKASIPEHPQGFIGVDVEDRIRDPERRYTTFENVVYVDPASLDVHFSDGRVADAAGIVRDNDGTYQRRNLGRYAKIAQTARSRAKRTAPDANWIDQRSARAAAEQADRRRLVEAQQRAKDELKKESRERGFEVTEQTFFDPSGGSLIDQQRLHPRDSFVGKRYLVVPINTIPYEVTNGGVRDDLAPIGQPSYERRVVEFGSDGTLRGTYAGGNFESRYYPRGDFGSDFLGVMLESRIPGVGNDWMGISRVRLVQPKAEKQAEDTGGSSAPRSRARGRTRGGSAPASRQAAAEEANFDNSFLALTDGRTDGSSLARTRFHAFLVPIDESEFDQQSQAQLAHAEAGRQLIDERHAAGLPVDVLEFPSWGPEFRGSFNGPKTQAEANTMLQSIWSSRDVTWLRHTFIAFQLVWAEMNPEPTVAIERFEYTQDGYEERNGFGVVVSR
ncbi:MAG: hypothetical protein AAFV77_06840, partial [Planctomycetota bacterium]